MVGAALVALLRECMTLAGIMLPCGAADPQASLHDCMLLAFAATC